MTRFGLCCCCPPPLLILCVLFPLCCTIRTLQWDTDPSVLQLQSDSELGYMPALLLLLWFLCYGCVKMLELLLLLVSSPFVETSTLINFFSPVSFPYIAWEKVSLCGHHHKKMAFSLPLLISINAKWCCSLRKLPTEAHTSISKGSTQSLGLEIHVALS